MRNATYAGKFPSFEVIKLIMKRSIVLKVWILVIGFSVLFQGCEKQNDQELKEKEMRLLEQYLLDNNITQEPTESGLYYIELTEGTGGGVEIDYIVDFNYTTELIDGTVIGSSYEELARENNLYLESALYGPVRVKVGYTTVPGLDEGLKFMKEGGSAKLILPSSINGFGKYSTALSPSYSTHIYTVDLINSFNDPEQFQTEQILNYLDTGVIEDFEITESGLYHIELQAGIGNYIQNGDVVEVWYTGSFLDGRVFDSNVGETALTVNLPADGYIPAWDEALKLMQKGSKARFIVPYDLAYGSTGDGYRIPIYMTLVFDLEIEDLVPN